MRDRREDGQQQQQKQTEVLRKPNFVPNAANLPPPPPDERRILALLGCSLVGFAFAVAWIVVGANGANDCPLEPMIPVFLTVSGAIALVASLFKIVQALTILAWLHGKVDTNSVLVLEVFIVYFVHFFLGLVGICWFIGGCVFVFRNFEPEYDDPSSSRYCDKGVYMFAFVSLSVIYVLGFIATILILCLFGCTCVILCMNRKIIKYDDGN